MLGLWGLPTSVVEAVAFHHTPDKCPSENFTPLVAVHAASHFSHSLDPAGSDPAQPAELDTSYMRRIGLLDRLSAWQESAATLNSEK